MKTRLLIFICFFTFSILSYAQTEQTYAIVMPSSTTAQNCQRCLQIFKQTPKEVQFSIFKDPNNTLYLQTNSKQWFNQMFQREWDGIAVDIVSKERYKCDLQNLEKSQIKGHLLKPVYKSSLKKGFKSVDKNLFRARIGKLPASFNNQELEYNILFINNQHLCMYYTVFNVPAYRWDLLDLGMYLDSLAYKSSAMTSQDDLYRLRNKNMKFIIPFEKNKSEYSPEDIRPMYDSLNLTDFNIKRIDIQAYSSVEGSLGHNIELQEQRANSIVKSLQFFQEPNIITKVNSSENWVEFLNDIENTSYSDYKLLSKNEVKAKLVGAEGESLEPILKNHRKAVINLNLEKIDRYAVLSAPELVKEFNKAVAGDNIEEAGIIQNSLFNRLMAQEVKPDILRDLQIPQQVKYIDLLNNNAAIKTLVDEAYLVIANNELKKLENLAPKNKKIKYNLAALKFKIWKYKVEPIDESAFLKEIKALKNYGIEKGLVDRMLINYYIIKSEDFMRKQDYANKDKMVAAVENLIKGVLFSDSDYLSLGQYLSYYSHYDKATEILQKRVNHIDVDEDLLFYYLNLTLIDKNLTQTDNYRTTMLNAANRNKSRYCKLFNAASDGGVTFQLLEDNYLRNSYCESCIE